jgi:hypothetical protein
MDDVVMSGRILVAAVLELVRVPDHLGEEGRERAKLPALALGREVDGLVDEGARERPVGLGAAAAELVQDRREPRLVLLLQIIYVRHAPVLSTRGPMAQ